MSDVFGQRDEDKTVVVCPSCLAAGRAQRTFYAMNTDRYFCLVHGPVVTSQLLWARERS